MDKILINNQVVMMRKFVKQAKVHVINNMVKQVKRLQQRKGSENQVVKAKRKAERLLSEIAILKKIKPDSVSRAALAKKKDWQNVLQLKNSSLEERCFALLANYEPLQTEVVKFLNTNTSIVPKISYLVEEWEEKNKILGDGSYKQPKVRDVKNKQREKRFTPKSKLKAKQEFNVSPKMIERQNEKLADAAAKLKLEEDSFIDSNIEVSDTEHDYKTESKINVALKNRDTGFKNIETNYEAITNFDLSDTSGSRNILPEHSEVNESTADPSYTSSCSEFTDSDEENGNDVLKSSTEVKADLKSGENFCHSKGIVKSEDYRPENNLIRKIDCKLLSLASEPNCVKKKSENSLKAVKILNLNELHDLDEIHTDSDEEKSNDVLKSNTKVKADLKSGENSCHSKGIVKSEDCRPENNLIRKIDCKLLSLASESNCVKKKSENSLKAVKILNLNELQDLDEIPTEISCNVDNPEEIGKRKNDPFFLGGDEVDFAAGDQAERNTINKNIGNRSFGDQAERNTINKNVGNRSFRRSKLANFDRVPTNKPYSDKKSFSGSFPQNKRNLYNRGCTESNFQAFNKLDRKSHFTNPEAKKIKGNRNVRTEEKGRFKDKRADYKFLQKDFSSRYTGKTQRMDIDEKAQFQKNKGSFSKHKGQDSENLPLHPSWEAKRKLKAVSAVTAFKGKRIVFEN